MKYLVGTIVYVTAEVRKQGFSARTGEIIYKNPRQRLYTVRFPRDKSVRYFAEHEITPLSQVNRPPSSKTYKGGSARPSINQTIILVLVVVGLSVARSALDRTPIIQPPPAAPVVPPGQPAPVPQPVNYSPSSPSRQPSIRILSDPANVGANSFTVTGYLINEGSVATVNNIVTVVVYGAQGQEIGRQQSDLGTLALQASKPFTASFTGDPSTIGSYRVFKQSKFWRTGP